MATKRDDCFGGRLKRCQVCGERHWRPSNICGPCSERVRYHPRQRRRTTRC